MVRFGPLGPDCFDARERQLQSELLYLAVSPRAMADAHFQLCPGAGSEKGNRRAVETGASICSIGES